MPIGRIATTEEIRASRSILASPASRYVTGAQSCDRRGLDPQPGGRIMKARGAANPVLARGQGAGAENGSRLSGAQTVDRACRVLK